MTLTGAEAEPAISSALSSSGCGPEASFHREIQPSRGRDLPAGTLLRRSPCNPIAAQTLITEPPIHPLPLASSPLPHAHALPVSVFFHHKSTDSGLDPERFPSPTSFDFCPSRRPDACRVATSPGFTSVFPPPVAGSGVPSCAKCAYTCHPTPLSSPPWSKLQRTSCRTPLTHTHVLRYQYVGSINTSPVESRVPGASGFSTWFDIGPAIPAFHTTPSDLGWFLMSHPSRTCYR